MYHNINISALSELYIRFFLSPDIISDTARTRQNYFCYIKRQIFLISFKAKTFSKLKLICTHIVSSLTQIYARCYLGCAFLPVYKFFYQQIKEIYCHIHISSSNICLVEKHKGDVWPSVWGFGSVLSNSLRRILLKEQHSCFFFGTI